jgi:hypothetical protein
MMAAHSALLRKFTDLAFDGSAEVRRQESGPTEADSDAIVHRVIDPSAVLGAATDW